MRGFSLCLLIVTKRNEDVNASIRVVSVWGGSVCGIITADCGWGRQGLKTPVWKRHEQARCLFHNRGIFFLQLCHEQARCLCHNRGIFFLQLCHEQARCLCHNRGIFFLVGWAREPAPKSFIENGATYEFQATLAIAVRSRGEVCPMPYALCPMHVGYLMLLRKAI